MTIAVLLIRMVSNSRRTISMSIYTFKPTYLYIKQHSLTGKLYFGKTYSKIGPEKYTGSGTHWKNHIKKHGKEHVVTLWYQLYDNVFDLVADALSFSYHMNIVESSSWLNQIIENGLDERIHIIHSEETRKKISISHIGKPAWNKGIPHNEVSKEKMKNAWETREPISNETRNKMSLAHIGNKASTGKKDSPKRIEEKRKFMLENNPMKNIESRKKVSDKLKGAPKSSEHKAKLLGRKMSEEAKLKMSMIAVARVKNGTHHLTDPLYRAANSEKARAYRMRPIKEELKALAKSKNIKLPMGWNSKNDEWMKNMIDYFTEQEIKTHV